MVLANVFSNMERIYHSQTLQFRSVGRNPHEVIYRELTLIWRTKLFSIFGYEEVAGPQEPRFSMIVGDLKMNALYIFDKAFNNNTSFCSVER
jgi:hypothetical protein